MSEKQKILSETILGTLGYYRDDCTTRVEEQKSEIDLVKKLLKSAGKAGKGGKGAPEFIVRDRDRDRSI